MLRCSRRAGDPPTVGRLALAALALLLLAPPVIAAAPPARADDGWTVGVVEEDDKWAPDNRDRHYTHGLRFSAVSPAIADPFWRAPFDFLADALPVFRAAPGEATSRHYEIVPIAQHMYTPQNGFPADPDPHDRPFAAWLYGGVGLLQDTGSRRFEELSARIGLVGPGAGGEWAQNTVHLILNYKTFNGWHRQLRNEPTLDLFYGRKARFHAGPAESGWGWEALPQFSLRAGNVYDYVGAGGMLRAGYNLLVDYGAPVADLSFGSDYFDPEKAVGPCRCGFAVFAGTEGRLVGHNLFLDGNSFRESRAVQTRWYVADLATGVAAFWGHWRLAYTYLYRTQEFVHQAAPDHFGSLNLSLKLPL